MFTGYACERTLRGRCLCEVPALVLEVPGACGIFADCTKHRWQAASVCGAKSLWVRVLNCIQEVRIRERFVNLSEI